MEDLGLLCTCTFQKLVKAVCPCRPQQRMYEINALLSILSQDPAGRLRIKFVFRKLLDAGDDREGRR